MPGEVLIITYYWPPSGGIGVQRWLKFTKYLPSAGWIPVILTVKPECAAYPFTDTSLYGDVPLDVDIFRTRATNYFSLYSKDKSKIPASGFANFSDNSFKGKLLRFIRGNLFIPDPRKGWNRYAYKKACEIIRTKNIKHIITTSPPHSTQLIGLRLKRKFKDIKWIADLRDPWTDIYYSKMFYPTYLSRTINASYEKKVLRNADYVTTVGVVLGRLFASKEPGIEQKIKFLPTGYDESDFNNKTGKTPGRFTISHVGTISEYNPIEGLLKALAEVQAAGFDFVLKFTGSINQSQRDLVEKYLKKENVEFIPYVAHDEAIQIMLDSSLLLLIIGENINNRAFISGKIFEYLASGKPILCLGPEDGEAAMLISRHKQGSTFSYNDVTSIKNCIITHIENPFHFNITAQEFSIRNQASHLAKILEQPPFHSDIF